MEQEQRVEDRLSVAFTSLEWLVDFSVFSLVVLVLENFRRSTQKIEDDGGEQKKSEEEEERNGGGDSISERGKWKLRIKEQLH